ncbi:MAG: flippase-like domain-containing protein [Anaerolineales bacterium]|nr:flippase-like domain-containing protein [Anaerolineales bacterium]
MGIDTPTITRQSLGKLVPGALLAGLAFWFSLRTIDFQMLLDDITSIDLGWLLIAIIIQVLALLARAARWEMLMGIQGKYWLTFNVMNIGYLFNTLLPFRLGEVVRPVLISARSDRNVYHTAATVVVERLLDIVMVVLVLLLTISKMSVPDSIRENGGKAGVLVLILFLLLFLAVRYQALVKRFLQSTRALFGDKLSGWLVTLFTQITVGFRNTTSPLQIGSVLGWSIISWALSIALNYTVMRAFTGTVNVIEAAFLVVPLTFSMTVPSSPGYVGVFELVGQQALVLPFGEKYTLSLAFTITLFIHTVFLVVTSLCGAAGLMTMRLSLEQIRKAASEALLINKDSQ